MSAVGAVLAGRPGVPVASAPPAPPPPPPPTTFLDLVTALNPVGVWRLNNTSVSMASDLLGRSPLTWVVPAPKPQRTTLVNSDSDGYAIDITAPCRGSIPHHASHIAANGGVFIVAQLRDTVAKQQIVNRYEGSNTAGRWLVEMTGNGQVTGKMTTDSGTITVSSAVGAITKGVPFGVALTWGTLGLNLYVNSATPVAFNVITQGSAGDRPTSVGAWYSGSSPASGLFGWLALFGTALSHSNIAGLMAQVKSSGIVLANNDEVTVAVGQTVTNIDVLANDDYSGTAAITITQQGSLGTASVQADKRLTYQAGSVGGADIVRYRVNGSNEATLSVTVTPNVPFFNTVSSTGWTLAASNSRLPYEANARLAEGPDPTTGRPCLIHQITTGQIISPLHQRISMPAAQAWAMRWRFKLSAGYNSLVQPNQDSGANGAKTIGIADTNGADGGESPTTGQNGWGIRLLYGRTKNSTNPWTWRAYSYHWDRTVNLPFGTTYDTQVPLVPGVWQELMLIVAMNDANTSNGHLRVFVDGVLRVERINLMWFPTISLPNNFHGTHMFGGTYSEMAAEANGQWYYSDWQLWTGTRSIAHLMP